MGLEQVNIVDLERALTAFFAEWLDMTVDAEIFRGQLPHGVESGVAVRVDGVEPTADYEEPDLVVQVLGKFDDRDAALDLLARLSRLAPLYGVEVGAFRLAYLLVSGSGAPYTAADGGGIRHFTSVNFRCALQ